MSPYAKGMDGTASATDGIAAATDGSAAANPPAVMDAPPSVTDALPSVTDGPPSVTDGSPAVTNGTPTVTDGPSGLTSAHLLRSVGKLLHERLLAHAHRSEVLELRRQMADSALLTEALDGLRPPMMRLYTRYERARRTAEAGRAAHVAPPSPPSPPSTPSAPSASGLSLRRFLDLCTDARLIGAPLSRAAARRAFVFSLRLSANSDAARRPLLTRVEFEEALVRLVVACHSAPAGHPALAGRVAPADRSTHTAAQTDAQTAAQMAAQTAAQTAAQSADANRTITLQPGLHHTPRPQHVHKQHHDDEGHSTDKKATHSGTVHKKTVNKWSESPQASSPQPNSVRSVPLLGSFATPKRSALQNRFSSVSMAVTAATSISSAVRQAALRTVCGGGACDNSDAAPTSVAAHSTPNAIPGRTADEEVDLIDLATSELERHVVTKLPAVFGALFALLADSHAV